MHGTFHLFAKLVSLYIVWNLQSWHNRQTLYGIDICTDFIKGLEMVYSF